VVLIPLLYNMPFPSRKSVRQTKRPINLALEATIRKELEKLLKDGIILSVKYSESVSNLVPVWETTG
jgi:hypothetical protein